MTEKIYTSLNHISEPRMTTEDGWCWPFDDTTHSTMKIAKRDKQDTKSICQMIIDVSRHHATPGVCATIVCLNAKGLPARGDDHISSVVLCGSTEFREKPDGRKVCRKCWTPMQDS